MASALAHSHIEAERRLRLLVTGSVEHIWRALPGYDRSNVDQWLSQVLPVIAAGQRQSASLTDAYIARVLGRRPLGIDRAEVTGATIRNGATPEEVYARPFVNVWTGLSKGVAFPDAVNAGLARATSTAAMDVQMSMRATANAVQQADPKIIGYERAADGGACEFCQEVDTAFVKSADAMALHNNCGCGLEPVTVQSRGQRVGSKGQHGTRVAIHDHGELGPVLAAPGDNFTHL